jgi:hypothetical protein
MYGDSLKLIQLHVRRAGGKEEAKETASIIMGCLLIFRREKSPLMIRVNIRII